MRDEIGRILIDEKTIKDKVLELGKKISIDYKEKNLFLVSVLKGSCIFIADLMRAIDIPLKVDFMNVSRYGNGAKPTGIVKIIKDLDVNIEGYDVLIVEDILDSGLTLSYIIELLNSRKPSSLRICTLLNKPERRTVNINLDYEGFIVPDVFVIGYGLDFEERYRNLPYIAVFDPENKR